MLTKGGVAVLPALFFEINALLLAVIVAAFIAHELTASWDVAYAVPRREVTPTEHTFTACWKTFR